MIGFHHSGLEPSMLPGIFYSTKGKPGCYIVGPEFAGPLASGPWLVPIHKGKMRI